MPERLSVPPFLFPLLLAAATLLAGCANFHVIEEGRYYRSGQLSAAGLRWTIERYDIKTVVRLRGGAPGEQSYEATAQPVAEAGIDLVHLPLSAMRYPTRDELLKLWEVFETAEYPMLVHCRAGADRTGLASAIYVLQRTGNLELALDQLAPLPYLHMGFGRAAVLDEVFADYATWHGRLGFPEWVRSHYRRTSGDGVPVEADARGGR